MPSSACYGHLRDLRSFPTRRSSDLRRNISIPPRVHVSHANLNAVPPVAPGARDIHSGTRRRLRHPRWLFPSVDAVAAAVILNEYLERSEEHTSELQSLAYLVCRLLLVMVTSEIYVLSLHDALPILEEIFQSRLAFTFRMRISTLFRRLRLALEIFIQDHGGGYGIHGGSFPPWMP